MVFFAAWLLVNAFVQDTWGMWWFALSAAVTSPMGLLGIALVVTDALESGH